MTKEKILSQYPSICWNCKNARHNPNIEKGIVGCVMLMKTLKNNPNLKEHSAWLEAFRSVKCQEIYEGWIHYYPPFADPEKYFGIMTKLQPLLKGVTYCPNYQPSDKARVIPDNPT